MKKLMCCFGTRPEFIKLAPVALQLKQRKFKVAMVCSGQHQELLGGLQEVFALSTDIDLDVRTLVGPTVNLSLLTDGIMLKFATALNQIQPQGVVVQGDAASTLFAALAAFHLRIPVFYVEAGLRTHDLSQPFPEEGYRQMVSRISSHLFAATDESKANLIAERISPDRVHVVGNTAVDAVNIGLDYVQRKNAQKICLKHFPWLGELSYRRLFIVTIHRREIQGPQLNGILTALLMVQKQNPEDLFVFPVHPNPAIRLMSYQMLKNNPRFVLIEQPSYPLFLAILSLATAVLSDSGGLQEEVPSIGIPILVLRQKTERPEGVTRGWAYVAGIEPATIVPTFNKLSHWRKPVGGNPYGDGKAAVRIAKIIHDTI